MTFLEVLALIGYSLGAWMHLWVSEALWRQRALSGEHQSTRFDLERVLFALALVIGVWHGCNLILKNSPMLASRVS